MGDVRRQYVVNRSGVRVGVDVGRDMDQQTFDSLVERGDLTPVKDDERPAKKAAAKPGK